MFCPFFMRRGGENLFIPATDMLRMRPVLSYASRNVVLPKVMLSCIFFYEKTGSGGLPTLHRGGRGWRGGFLGSMLEDLLKLDMRKWLQLLHNLDLLPRILGQDWSVIFLQNFGGNVTIVPLPMLRDYGGIIFDPGYEGMKHYIEDGQKNSWPKICMIANRVKIEQAIQSALGESPK